MYPIGLLVFIESFLRVFICLGKNKGNKGKKKEKVVFGRVNIAY